MKVTVGFGIRLTLHPSWDFYNCPRSLFTGSAVLLNRAPGPHPGFENARRRPDYPRGGASVSHCGGQRAADHRYDCRRSVENVSSGEAKKSIPGIDQPVLAAVVCGEALAVRCFVVIAREPDVGVREDLRVQENDRS